MSLLALLKQEAVQRGLFDPSSDLDAPAVFVLVREMPYRRASDRVPETIIKEWQGTCSGKHYLLKALFAELELSSQVMACTTTKQIDPSQVPADLFPLYEAANRRFVDVHNYLLLELPDGSQMQVDATWPLAVKKAGMRVNEVFLWGKDQELAADPLETWPIPEACEPQTFKDELLRRYFTPAELKFREIVIQAMGEKTSTPA
jgi:hypothetical protein